MTRNIATKLIVWILAAASCQGLSSPASHSSTNKITDDIGTRSSNAVKLNANINRRDAFHHGFAAVTTTASTSLLLTTFPCIASADITATSSSTVNPIATLSDGTKFPLASFGLQVYDDSTAYRLTMLALETGYRNFFASVLAGNQRGFAKAVKDSGVPRNELFICGSVVSNRAQGFDAAKTATTKGWNRNLEAFAAGDIMYLDQIMLDYPGEYFGHCLTEFVGQ